MPLQFTLQDDFAAPAPRVFAVMTDLEQASRWMQGLVRIEQLTPPPFGRGARWREVRRVYGREASEVFEVTAHEPDHSLELYVDGTQGSSKRGYYRFRYELHPSGNRTALALYVEIGGIGAFFELVGRFLIGSFKKEIVKDLQAMKRYIESTSA